MTVSVNLAGGGFVIVWQTRDGIYFQRFDANRLPLGSPVTVTNASTLWLTAAPTSSGGFSVIWDTGAVSAPMAQDFNSSGATVGSTYTLAAPPAAQLGFTSLQATQSASPVSSSAVLPDAGYVLARVDHPSGGAVTVHVQRYDAASDPVGPEFVRNAGIDLVTEATVVPLTDSGYEVSY